MMPSVLCQGQRTRRSAARQRGASCSLRPPAGVGMRAAILRAAPRHAPGAARTFVPAFGLGGVCGKGPPLGARTIHRQSSCAARVRVGQQELLGRPAGTARQGRGYSRAAVAGVLSGAAVAYAGATDSPAHCDASDELAGQVAAWCCIGGMTVVGLGCMAIYDAIWPLQIGLVVNGGASEVARDSGEVTVAWSLRNGAMPMSRNRSKYESMRSTGRPRTTNGSWIVRSSPVHAHALAARPDAWGSATLLKMCCRTAGAGARLRV